MEWINIFQKVWTTTNQRTNYYGAKRLRDETDEDETDGDKTTRYHRRPRSNSHVQNTNFICSNILQNSAWLSTKRIYIWDLDALLQILTKTKAYYLEIKEGLLEISWKFQSFVHACGSCLEEKFGHFRLPTNKPDTVRKQVDESGATRKTWKEKPRAEAWGGRGKQGSGA